MSMNFWKQKVCWHFPVFCLYILSRLSCPAFTDSEGDGIESRQPFQIFSTLPGVKMHLIIWFNFFFSSTFLFAWCLLSTIVPGGNFLQSTLPKIFSPFTFSHKHDFHFNLSLFCYSFWIKTLEMWDSFSKWNKIRSSVKNENNQILFN